MAIIARRMNAIINLAFILPYPQLQNPNQI